MRLVVADTTPLHYLILIEQIGLLPTLFQTIYAPPAVLAELSHEVAPRQVRDWAINIPGWVQVFSPNAINDQMLDRLDDGERAAICLAVQLDADLVLIDDRAGVVAARSKGFAVTGTLGVLDFAARKGLIQLQDAFNRLKATSFRCRPEIMDAILRSHFQVNEPVSSYTTK